MLTAKAAGAILLTILICAALPTILLVNGQTNQRTEEKMVALADQASNEIQTLVASIVADDNATARIANVRLTEQFQGNITLFQTDGLGKLTAAKEASANCNYHVASESALEALTLFRHIYSSLQSILSNAGIKEYAYLTDEGLADAITRELQRIETLQGLIPTDTPQNVLNLLNSEKTFLIEAKSAIQKNQTIEAERLYLQAKPKITEIYQYLKTQAEASNSWRLSQYCETLQLRIQARLNYGNANGVDFTSTMQSLGYQNEAAFMQALRNKIQAAESETNIQAAIAECLSLSQMVQETEQAINQDINRQQQGQATPSNNNGADNGDSTIDPSTGGNGSNSGGSNNGGNSSYGGSGNGAGGNR